MLKCLYCEEVIDGGEPWVGTRGHIPDAKRRGSTRGGHAAAAIASEAFKDEGAGATAGAAPFAAVAAAVGDGVAPAQALLTPTSS